MTQFVLLSGRDQRAEPLDPRHDGQGRDTGFCCDSLRKKMLHVVIMIVTSWCSFGVIYLCRRALKDVGGGAW